MALAWEGGEAGELPRVMGSDKVLSDRLAQLTSAGVIERHRTPGWPPRVRYVLTSQGRALEPVMRSMWEWGMVRRNALG
ncbi:winged helix-turn-helix transcriptional regulator [Streptomyces sp. NPDC029006]|uniref:winged helix-turn-helix transcriptional regulator n=1 Tax=Streptomyces sp. NPDC029006 TaxID=3155467 RepID=UPI0033D80857